MNLSGLIENLRLICTFFIPFSIIINESGITNIFLCIATLICIYKSKQEKGKWLNFDKLMLIAIILFCIGLILSNCFAIITPSNSLKWAYKYCSWIFVGIVMYGIWENRKINSTVFLAGVSIACIVLCFYGAYESIFLNITRPKSLTANPNSWSGLLTMSLPFVLYCINNKFIKSMISLIIFYGIVLSGSRGSFIALLIIGILYVINFLKNGNRNLLFSKLLTLTLIISVLIGGIYFFIPNNAIVDRFYNLQSYSLEKSGGDRYYLWFSAIDMFADRPWTGVGLQNFNEIYINEGYINSNAREPNLKSPHNIFLHYLTEMGIVGTLPLVVLFIVILYMAFNNYSVTPMATAMFSSIIAIIINNMVDYQLIGKYYYQLFWVLVLAFLADLHVSKQNKIL